MNSAETTQSITTPYSSYILRLWHTSPDSAWRVTLKDVRSGSLLNFTAIKPLVEFLVTQAEQTGETA